MRRLTRAICIAAALALSALAHGQCGDPGSCTEVHATPGCVVTECCAQVCKANPLCCEFSWDEECVALADDLCDGLTCPGPGSCDSAHFTPGCEDTVCCQFTCSFDAYCCFVVWDAICVEGVTQLCGVAACTITIPGNAVDEEEHCYERLNDGCNFVDASPIAIACGAVRTGKYSSGGPRDTDWYSFEVTSSQRYHAELAAEFPSQLLLLRGSCYGPLETVAELHALPCATSALDVCLTPGSYALVVSGGLPDLVFRRGFTCDEIDPDNPPDPKDPPPEPAIYGLHYVLSFECVGCLIGDLNGDGTVGAADLGILLGAWGGAGPADLDGDGGVGAADLGILLGAWS